ncbi:MAG: hypothetical protein ACTS22_08990 [Phycisphaerales bacterium]
MSRSSDARRRYVRSADSIVRRAKQSGLTADGLTSAAGHAGGIERARVEQLEPRKLLFSVTVDDSFIDPVTGLGLAEGFFGYFIPLLQTSEDVTIEPDELVTEDFNDEDLGAVFSGDVFDQSDVLFLRGGAVTSRIVQPVPDVDEQRLDLRITNPGSFFSFATLSDSENANGPRNVNTAVTFSVGSGGNAFRLLNGQIEVELLFEGQVVDTFDQADLTAIGQNVGAETNYTLFSRNQGVFGGVFDEVRFVQRAPTGGNPEQAGDFFIDDLNFLQPAGNFADVIGPRAFGVSFSILAPVGATVQFLDIYGRDMIQTIRVGGSAGNTNVVRGDFDDDGVPDFNDGIGRIIMTGFDSTSSFKLTGGTIEFFDGPAPDGADFTEGGDAAFFYAETLSLYDDFEEAGFGFFISGEDSTVSGLPDDGPGTVIIGSQFVRPLNDYDPLEAASLDFDFSRDDQGIFLNDGSSIGQVTTNAILFGSSNFNGSVGQFSSGYFLGSLAVAGDLGGFYAGTDAGAYQIDPDAVDDDDVIVDFPLTNSQVVVGRTLGDFAVAGRSFVDITVEGDLSSLDVEPDDVLVYDERELVFGISLDADPAAVITAQAEYLNGGFQVLPQIFTSSAIGTIPGTIVNATAFGDTYYRNDSILNAEFVGGAASAVVVRGSLGGQDPINTGQDASDVYAFAVDGSTEVVIETLSFTGVGFRVVDVDGRTVAATSGDFDTAFGQVVRFNPDTPGVYYLVLHNPTGQDVDEEIDAVYSVLISGMAPTTLGSYRTGLGGGSTQDTRDNAPDGFQERASITVLSGSVGSVRIGTGYVSGAGTEESTVDFINVFGEEDDEQLNANGLSLSTPGSLYSFVSGGDINSADGRASAPVSLSIGRDLGTFHTGRSPIAGIGDAGLVRLDVGGRIGLIDINGSIAADTENADGFLNRFPGDTFIVRTGLDPDLDGDIGLIIVGQQVTGDALTIDTSASPGAVVGGLLISQRTEDFGRGGDFGDDLGIFDSINGVNLVLGQDSDIRFVDTPRIDLLEGQNSALPLIIGQPLELVDDAGGRVEIVVSQDGIIGQVVAGRVIVVPVDDGEGVAIARIEIDLTGTGTIAGGRTLTIRGLAGQDVNDVISIGRILVTASDANSRIQITGNAQIDVWRIDAPEGLDRIENFTPRGDIVAIDTLSLDTLRITGGDLGRTQVPEYGPRLIGPVLGLTPGLNGTVGGALGFTQGEITDQDWNGQIYRPTTDTSFAAGNAYLDDIGSPFDDALNGLAVRTGSVTLVESNRSIGDVILQDAAGDLTTVRANADRITPNGEFEGIIGSIFAGQDIDLVDIGDGIIRTETGTNTPFAETGIYAERFIRRVQSTIDGAFISSNIIAAFRDAGTGVVSPFGTEGIDSISLTGGDIRDAFIGSTDLDQFYRSRDYGNEGRFRGDLRQITLTNGDLFGSVVTFRDVETITITNGFFDATDLSVLGELSGSITADGFRNTTLEGDTLEFRLSRIAVGEDLEQLTARQGGTISDTTISVLGDIENGLTAGNLVRTNLQVANTIRSLIVSDSILASSITAGQLVAVTVTDTVQLSSFSIAGPIVNFRVQNEIVRSQISVTGPDGRIDRLSAANDLDADISSSGRIGTIESQNGSIAGSIVTTTDRGDINMISAAVDLAASTDIGGDLNMLEVGRNIGSADAPSVVLVRGDVTELDVSGGRIISDLRVGGRVTQGITVGGVTNLPTNAKAADGDITVFGRIAEVSITGDYDGLITSESGGIGTVTILNGSLLAGGGVIANDGGIGTVSIIAGHLLGNIYADQTINLISVQSSADGSFGDIGINNQLSSGTASSDSARNQLPPGVVATGGNDGPVIASGRAINSIIVSGGDIIEALIYARTSIGTIAVNGSIRNNQSSSTQDQTTVIAAGDLVREVLVTGAATDVLFLAGVTSFGDDPIFTIADPLYNDRAGGTGADADTIKSGRIQTVTIGGNATDVAFSAGMTAGNDGEYNTGDAGEGHVVGLSIVDQITILGTQTNVTVNADRAAAFVNGTNVRASNFGGRAPNADGLLAPLTDAFVGGSIDLSQLGTLVPRNGSQVFTWNGTSFRVNWNAPAPTSAAEAAGQGVVWDASTGTLILANTRITHDVTITVLDNDANAGTALPSLIDFNIRSNDEASIGTLRITGENGTATVAGNSSIVIDNYASTIALGNFNSSGRIVVGADIGTLTATRIAGASVQANFVRTTNITGSVVTLSGQAPRFDYSGAGSFTVTGNATAEFNVDRSINTLRVNGSANGLLFRAGGSLTAFEAGSVSRSRLSVANTIGSIDVVGDVFDTSFIAGGDLGTDLRDGDGSRSSDIDRVTSGIINEVDIGGSFAESDIVAGFLRGADGFFGSADDAAAAGISSIGTVTIDGTRTGSNVNSESYAILAAGTINEATIGGQDAESRGNLVVGPVTSVPLPIRVDGFRVLQDARSYTAFFTFNQNIDESSFLDALRIREARNEDDAQQPWDPADPLSLQVPTPGVPGSGDYSITYDEATFTFAVTIDRAITDRDLVDNGDGTFSLPSAPAPGVYRFELSSAVLRALNAGARLDGDGDGFSIVGDDFSADAVVGDAGDVAGPRPIERVTVMGDNGDATINFYGAVNLDLLLDSNRTPDGLPETNTVVRINGALGDHPDRDLNLFGFGGDKDLYAVTLQAGQILRLGEVTGPANQLIRSVYFQPVDGSEPLLVSTASGGFESTNETAQAVVLPSSTPELTDIGTDTALLIKQTGTYYIVAESASVSEAPFTQGAVPNQDPQPNQIGNYAFDIEVFDDGNSGFNAGTDAGNGTNIVYAPPPAAFTQPGQIITIGDFSFTLENGVVRGQNSDGSIVSTRNGTRLESVITSSIGSPGLAGAPGEIQADVDIFHLNNFQPVQAGSLVTITVGLSDTGADLGSTIRDEADAIVTGFQSLTNQSRNVQFALFETTNSSDAESADLVFSPTDFQSRAGTPDTILASNGATRYGYDSNGDFFISFVVPPSFDGGNGTFAVYLQGAFRADYELRVVTQGTASYTPRTQNVLIEANGGTIDWLGIQDEVSFGGFDAGTLGFAGLVSNVSVESFILAEVTQRLNGFFDAIGLDVNFSTNPAEFEFEPFSTVFLTSDANPVGLLTLSDYGVSERSDPFNTDLEDEAVVFAPAYATLGFSPSPTDLENFIDSIAAGIGRRVGELVGLRLTVSNPLADVGGNIDIQSEESIAFPRLDPQSSYVFSPDSRELVGFDNFIDDTAFFLGDQRAVSLLDTILADD